MLRTEALKNYSEQKTCLSQSKEKIIVTYPAKGDFFEKSGFYLKRFLKTSSA
jgi:hypothetical protein